MVPVPVTPARHCLPYSQVTGNLATYGDPLGGMLLYNPMRFGQTLTIGDPLADESQVGPLLDRFLQAHPRAGFVQCSENTARLLQARGFFVNSFGIESELVLNRWSSSGKLSHMLRKIFNKADRLGVKVVEITDDREQLEIARSVSYRWLVAAKQIRRELRLLTRPPITSEW